jgi:Primase X
LILQQVSTIGSTTSSTTKTTAAEIENGLDFILLHFNHEKLFPRRIQTGKSEGRQIEVFSKQEVLSYFKESDLLDCKINSFPSYTEYHGIQRYPPDLIFIDIDRSTFKDDKSFENALSITLRNIKRKLLNSDGGSSGNGGGFPTVNRSGNGYHIIQPIECPILEQIEQFKKYQDSFFVSQEFLRFAKNYLSNGKADKNNYPSFKSCQIRIPGSINSKCLDNRDKRLSGNIKVKTLQKWNGVRPYIRREFIEDFRTYLEQKITDQENNNYNQNHYSNNNHIEWIENKILQTPFKDGRKKIVELILVPYFVLIKKLSNEEFFQIINEWLQKCDSVRKLDFDIKDRVNTAIKKTHKKQIGPMRYNTLKENYKDLYLLLLDQNNNKDNVKEEEVR